ncbi:hypothetical protein TYRP_020159 [Tyrophagus putrescentiae]|nr:hypothetical protein TYRP_020159 [Tyrophagus putrescentiae]
MPHQVVDEVLLINNFKQRTFPRRHLNLNHPVSYQSLINYPVITRAEFEIRQWSGKCDRLLDIQGASWHFQLSLHWIALQYQSRRHANWKKVHRSSRIHDTNELCRPNPDLHGEVILEIIILSNEHHVSSE